MAGAATVAVALLWPSALFGQTWQVVEYYDTDTIGSVRVVTDAAGPVVARHDFLLFGEELSPQTPPHDKKLYTGQERDVETGRDYFGARQLRTDLGRFTPVGPLLTIEENLVDPQRWNRYVYARNNPLAYVDPSGLAIELLGSEEDRERALGVLQEGLGGTAGGRLYINAVTSGDTTRYFVGIQGSVDEFKGLAGNVSSSLGDLILNQNVVEFGLTGNDLSRFGGGATYGPGEAGDNANVRVLINPAQIGIGESRLSPTSVLGAMKWDPGEVRGLTMPITAWHEFGHAWGGIHGRPPISPATNAEALIWENYMRLATYGPFGPGNARRRIH